MWQVIKQTKKASNTLLFSKLSITYISTLTESKFTLK